jgi:MFS transporter, YNFM family, putative membrane transport protein
VAGRATQRTAADMAGLLFGAAGMFATMYSTQAILPDLADAFDVSPSRSGLTISVVVIAIAIAAWFWGPISDRYGRRDSMMLASALLVAPTVGAALAPSFPALLAFRALQGLCMPGLLIVGVPYVAEVFAPDIGGRAMGLYVAALVAGGLIGRVGVGLLTAVTSWRVGLGVLALLPLGAAVVMRRGLPDAPPAARTPHALHAVRGVIRNPAVLRPALAASAMFFTFVSVASYLTYRVQRAPFDWGTATTSLLFVLWALGAVGPLAGRLADRVGWPAVAMGALSLQTAGVLISLPPHAITIVIGLGAITLGVFSGVTATQLGVVAAGAADRGVASALYFSFYYVAAALAGFLPGLAWEAWRWPGVAASALGALAIGLFVLAVGRGDSISRRVKG